MNKLVAIIEQIDLSVKNPNQYPDPIVVAIMQNDLRAAISCAHDWRCTVDDLDRAIRHVDTYISGRDIQWIVRKWGKK